MLIDWFTVVAQTVNFLVLVWLLKRFFYQPILNALDARERRIAAELADADAKKMAAEKERNEFQHKNDEFDRQRAALLNNALSEAQAERQRLLSAAQNDFDNLRASREKALSREYRSLSEALTRKTCAEVFAIARKVLADLASTTLEAHVVEAFIRRMRELGDDEKAQLASAFQSRAVSTPAASTAKPTVATVATVATAATVAEEVLVRSAFDLSAQQQNSIAAALKEILGVESSVRFATEPELVSGIELVTNGHKVAWSIENHLASLEKEIGKLLENQTGSEPDSGSASAVEIPPESR
ncbi:F0F1 ATP synthase subunit delta [Nitrosovibrio sp. Nv6]|uniref:F0F1 ATP synthase subunit delta n=1 Tax=Nitrosovibrio sp. Nv6 TaxID=1855340 RepID=UPI0008B087A2|nr:F0F1 ATP synthase subunit delta [Nitrosovibrio sp. Nv6]SEO38684.1 F-type H+-transporting ATPase subunit b [Nitrosovibrio sp. Nv6]